MNIDAKKGESIISIVQIASDYKQGQKEALNDLFMVKVYTKDMQKSHKAKGGIRNLVIHDVKINNLFNQYVKKTIKGIEYDNRYSLFYSSLVQAFKTLQISNDEQAIYKHIQSTIKRSFDEEKKRIEAIEKQQEQTENDRKKRLIDVRMKSAEDAREVFKQIKNTKDKSKIDKLYKRIDFIIENKREKENAIIAEWWS